MSGLANQTPATRGGNSSHSSGRRSWRTIQTAAPTDTANAIRAKTNGSIAGAGTNARTVGGSPEKWQQAVSLSDQGSPPASQRWAASRQTRAAIPIDPTLNMGPIRTMAEITKHAARA